MQGQLNIFTIMMKTFTFLLILMSSAGFADDQVHPLYESVSTKFGDAVVDALDLEPRLPEHLSDLLEREERCETVAPELAAMQQHVRAVTSAG